MGNRLRRLGRRLARLGTDFVDVFLRGNKVLPPVLAAMAVFVVAWLLAGVVLGGGDREPDQKPVAHKADLAQSDDAPGAEPVDPDVENRDVDSYAAYRSKDPFRELIAPAETTSEQTTPESEATTGTETTRPGPRPGESRDTNGEPDRGGQTAGPNNRDTDGDGTPDRAANDSSDDGRPGAAGAGRGPGDRAGNPDRSPSRGPGGNRGGGLLDSGGILPPP